MSGFGQGDDRYWAATLFNRVWVLLDKAGRTRADDVEMVHLAHASRAHWQAAGGPREWAIGEWQVSRVYCAVGRAEPALFHARLAADLASDGALGAFLAASTQEGLARALRLAGEAGDAAKAEIAARSWLDRIEDGEERAVVEADLAG